MKIIKLKPKCPRCIFVMYGVCVKSVKDGKAGRERVLGSSKSKLPDSFLALARKEKGERKRPQEKSLV